MTLLSEARFDFQISETQGWLLVVSRDDDQVYCDGHEHPR